MKIKMKIRIIIVNLICILIIAMIGYTFYENIKLKKELIYYEKRLVKLTNEYNTTVTNVNKLYDFDLNNERENKSNIDNMKNDIVNIKKRLSSIDGKPVWYVGN